MFDNLSSIFISGALSLITTLILVLTARWHGNWTYDSSQGLQKFHEKMTPRIGGIAILCASMIPLWVSKDQAFIAILKPIVVCGLIPFCYGFKEDVSKHGDVPERLLATILAAAALTWLSDISIVRLDITWLDAYLHYAPLATLITVIAITGLTNAINILDGFNGLASGTSAIIFLFFSLLAISIGDIDLAELSLVMLAALVGFMLVNYPWGRIFMGDSGAYFTGFMMAAVAILIPLRNPHISPWACLLICAYPVWETLYSMIRRLMQGGRSGHADRLHLHSLIKTRLISRHLQCLPGWIRNSLVAPWIWVVNLALGGIAMQYFMNKYVLMSAFAIFVAMYLVLYRWLIQLPEVVPLVGQSDE